MNNNNRPNDGTGFLWFVVFFFFLVIAGVSSGCTSHEGTAPEEPTQPVFPERTR